MGDIYKWCCKNPDCRFKNVAEQSQINETLKAGDYPALECAWCGIIHNFVEKGTKEGANFLECIPFKGWEKRVPKGSNPDGTFQDYLGKTMDADTMITLYGIDPEQYLKWRDAGKPKPQGNERC